MLDTYKAILKGNTVIWANDSPAMSLQDQEIEILVTVLVTIKPSSHSSLQRGGAMAHVSKKLN